MSVDDGMPVVFVKPCESINQSKAHCRTKQRPPPFLIFWLQWPSNRDRNAMFSGFGRCTDQSTATAEPRRVRFSFFLSPVKFFKQAREYFQRPQGIRNELLIENQSDSESQEDPPPPQEEDQSLPKRWAGGGVVQYDAGEFPDWGWALCRLIIIKRLTFGDA